MKHFFPYLRNSKNLAFCLLLIISTLASISCIKYDADADLIQNIVNSKLEIGKDISLSDSENINLKEPRIYEKDGRYYFGQFYYLYDNRVYYIDAVSSNIGVSYDEKVDIIFSEYNDVNNAKIMNVDKSSLYITHLSSMYLPTSITTNMYVLEQSPDLEEDVSESAFITNVNIQTNFTQSNVVSLTKMHKAGEIEFTLQNILDTDTTILKIISTEEYFYIVYRQDAIMLDKYSNDGEYIDTSSLGSTEAYDSRNNKYIRIIDITYLKDRNTMAILTENLENGKITSRNVLFTDDFEDFYNSIEITDINDSQVVSLSSSGLLIALEFDLNKYTLLKYDIHTRRRWVSYIESRDVSYIGSFDIFDNDIATFNLNYNEILFYKY